MLRRGQFFAGRYYVLECLAQGGMGVVYAAKHAVTGERVALKVLWPKAIGSRAEAKNFQLEARVASMLGGEHIVRVLDAGFDEPLGAPFLAMELLRGHTLEALVRGRGSLAPAEVFWALRQVAEALDRAHGHVDSSGRPAPIVHRDLKPENLFLAERERGEPVVKVLDFGIAKVLSERQTLSQELRGTPLFMACEQIEGGALTPRVDLWALGLIAFYLMTGRYYWHSATKPDAGFAPLFNEVLRRPFEAPSERARAFGLAPPWPPAFDPWFLRCISRDPARRFASAGAALESLSAVLGVGAGRPIASLGPEHARAARETPTAAGTPSSLARLPGAPKASSAPPTTVIAERLTRPSTTSELGGSSHFIRSRRNRTKQRVLRGAWGAAGFVAGGVLTALALHAGLGPATRAPATPLASTELELEPVAAVPLSPAAALPSSEPAAPPQAEAPPQVEPAPPLGPADAPPPTNAASPNAVPKLARVSAPAPRRADRSVPSVRPDASGGRFALTGGVGSSAPASLPPELDIELSR
jgi:eukaryotic-like serine/threonine-protein kinase